MNITALATCQGKVSFDSKALALEVSRRPRRQSNGKRRRPLRAYKCQFCNRWHIGDHGGRDE